MTVKRAIRINGDLAYVPLTRGYETVIDATDIHLVDGCNWCAAVIGNTVYAVRTVRIGEKRRNVSMHRTIMGHPEGLEIDHVDGDGLNNRRDNLRKATTEQNQRNQRLNCLNTSGYKGVTMCGGKWQSRIQVRGKQIFLGRHDTPGAAHAAYCEASAKYHGEFGRVS